MFIYDGKNTVPKDVTCVTIGSSSPSESSVVTYIKVSAFEKCTKLKTIIIPHTVSHIGESAFEGCTSLLSVHFELPPQSSSTSTSTPSSSALTYIGEDVFKGCKSLIYINIPPSVTYIGDHIFYGCDALLSVITNYRDVFGLVKDRYRSRSSRSQTQPQYLSRSRSRSGHGPGPGPDSRYDVENEYYPLHHICSSLNITLRDLQRVISSGGEFQLEEDGGDGGGINDNDNSNSNNGSNSDINNDGNSDDDRNTVMTMDLTITDPWGFTPLHVLCCNPNATSEMIQYLLEHTTTSTTATTTTTTADNSRTNRQQDDDDDDDEDATICCNIATMMEVSNGMKPIDLYLACKCKNETPPYNYGDLQLCLALKLGMKWESIERMMTMDSDSDFDRTKSLEQGRRDEKTHFFPFMLAAIHPLSDLESVYRLALYNIDNI